MTSPNDVVHEEVRRKLERQAEDVARISAGLDESSFSRQPTPGKWSVKELVCHLLRVQQVFVKRIDSILSEDRPKVVPYHPDGDSEFEALRTKRGSEVLDMFLKERRALVSRLGGLSSTAWHREGQHPEYPYFTLHFAVEYMAHHEAHHIYQMYTRRGQPLPD